MSGEILAIIHRKVDGTKLSRKVLYYFIIFATVNKIIKNCLILIFNNFLLKYYQLYRKTVRDKNCCFLLIKF